MAFAALGKCSPEQRSARGSRLTEQAWPNTLRGSTLLFLEGW